jgi:hypothetical protein
MARSPPEADDVAISFGRIATLQHKALPLAMTLYIKLLCWVL